MSGRRSLLVHAISPLRFDPGTLPLPRPTHHRCLWRGQMQSGERERAGSSSQREERLQEGWPGGRKQAGGTELLVATAGRELGNGRLQRERCVVTTVGGGAACDRTGARVNGTG